MSDSGGEHNIGELSRKAFGVQSYRIGFGTDHGKVATAVAWEGAVEIKQVRIVRTPDTYPFGI